MRTTVSIADGVLAAARQRAREQDRTLGEVIEEALQRALAAGPDPGPRPAVPVFRGGTGPRPGVDLTSNRALHEVLDEDVEPGLRR